MHGQVLLEDLELITAHVDFLSGVSSGIKHNQGVSGFVWGFLRPVRHFRSSRFRYASRQLLKSPVFTLVSLLSLGLGIGATTSVFSVIYGALLHPFPYRGADRMVTFRVTDAAGYNGFTNYLLLSARQFEDIQKAEMLDGVIATDNWDMAATGQDLPEAVHTGKLSANAFDYFGVPPILGRVFTSADGPFGEAPQRVVVLSYRFWQGHFGGDRAVLGKTLQLDHEDYRIIGVVPLQFAWFHSDVYVPLRLTNDPDRVSMIDARLKSGITIKAAEDGLQPLIESFAKESPKHFPRSVRLRISNLNAAVEKRLTGTLSVLFIAVTLLLAVGCANVSILLLTRATARRHELAVRAAIGASRQRIIRQLLTEALLLAMMGCLVGVAVAYRSVPFILRKMPENSFPNEAAIHVNGSGTPIFHSGRRFDGRAIRTLAGASFLSPGHHPGDTVTHQESQWINQGPPNSRCLDCWAGLVNRTALGWCGSIQSNFSAALSISAGL
ncbi:MAG: ABC transporter permease [Bryobacteraceae bacterium]